MVKISAIAIAICFLLLCTSIASAKIIGNFSTDTTGLKTVTLDQARVNETDTSVSTPSNTSQPATNTENVQNQDVVSGWVTNGLNNWLKGLIGGMYDSFDNNSAINNQFGTPRGALYTAITYVPNPYQDPTIKSLFLNYNTLAIFAVIIFIFGEWCNRNLAQMKVTSSVFGDKDLSTSKFFGRLCMCG